jgi:hypothetical protein
MPSGSQGKSNLRFAGGYSFSGIAKGPTKILLKDLPDLTGKARDRIWAKSEKARRRLRRAQRRCFVDDPFDSDVGGRCLESGLAIQASTDYALTYFTALADEYMRMSRSYLQLRKLLTTAIRFVDAEVFACWKGLSFDDQTTFESLCLPKVRNALRDEKNKRLEESLDSLDATQERPTPTQPALAGDARKAGVQIRKGLVNLSDQQKDLLLLLVSKHQSNGAQPFLFVRSHTGAGLCYPGGDSLPVINDDLDFHQLRRENLITLNPVGKNQWRGKPTERGITAVSNGFSLPADGGLNPEPITRTVPVSRVSPPPRIIAGIENLPTMTFRIPNIDINDCSSHLDDTERDKIKAAELRAVLAIKSKQSSIRSQAEQVTLLLRDWVLPIFATFSKLACNRVSEGVWHIHKAEMESREFVELLAALAGMNSPDAWMAGRRRLIRAEIWEEIEKSREWKSHQQEMLHLIDGANKVVTENEHGSATQPPATSKLPDPSSADVPTVADIEAALNYGDRKKAVALRCRLDRCNIKELWMSAFRERAGKESTKLSAFNRWQMSRADTPSWADELIRKRLVQ